MKVVTLTPAEIDAWRAATRPVLDHYLEQSGPLGAKVYQAVESLR